MYQFKMTSSQESVVIVIWVRWSSYKGQVAYHPKWDTCYLRSAMPECIQIQDNVAFTSKVWSM